MASGWTLKDMPAMVPPEGQMPNFVNPETMHPVVLGVAIGTMVLMVIALVVRIFTKAFLLRQVKIEDYSAILGTAGIILWESIFIYQSKNGFSRHLWNVRLVDIENLSYWNYLAEISYASTMFLAKSSILFQFKRIFCPGSRRDPIWWCIHILLVLNAGHSLSAIFTYTFQCTPREKAWKPLMDGHCINIAAAIIFGGAMNLFLDLGMLITPIWAIFRLQLPTRRKVGVSAVFAVGILTCAIATVGVVVRIPLLSEPDLTWIITKVGIWTMIEYCGTILVGCMPSFPRFFLFLQGKEPSITNNATRGSYTTRSRPKTAGSIKSNVTGKRPWTGHSHSMSMRTVNSHAYKDSNATTAVGVASPQSQSAKRLMSPTQSITSSNTFVSPISPMSPVYGSPINNYNSYNNMRRDSEMGMGLHVGVGIAISTDRYEEPFSSPPRTPRRPSYGRNYGDLESGYGGYGPGPGPALTRPRQASHGTIRSNRSVQSQTQRYHSRWNSSVSAVSDMSGSFGSRYGIGTYYEEESGEDDWSPLDGPTGGGYPPAVGSGRI
ncbi:hypothetical protein QBC45DRAFT_410361 [Copromyces sp. CBS 386.78]|nr:hypothetical protein QBC45DRAFT_410361 [Copromyces sp. CBS 386.78]